MLINSNLKNSVQEDIEQIVHDIRSPIACLKMIYTASTNLSEQDKILFYNSMQRITRIIDSFEGILNRYKNKAPKISEFLNIHSLIEQILTEKRSEYLGCDIEFCYCVPEKSKNILVSGSTCEFERMLSNLINNAVEACSNKGGKITINLDSDTSNLYLLISDNGKGIPAEILEKLRNGIAVTYGKDNGSGLGFTQIRDAVRQLEGKFTIDSTVGVGTKFSLKVRLNKICFE